MNDVVLRFVEATIQKEGNGKYTNDPKDSGGPTRWGITEAVARAFGYGGPMSELPRETAVHIYVERYWDAPGFRRISHVSETLAERLFDFGVLASRKYACEYLQRCLNVLNRNGRDYPDIAVDGVIGNMTIGALDAFNKRRGKEGMRVLVGMVVSMMSVYLINLAERRPKDEEYQFGWQLNRAIGAILFD